MRPDATVTVATFCRLLFQLTIDGVLVRDLMEHAYQRHHVTEYDGPPCPLTADSGPCRHGGQCVPRLNQFDCRCARGFTGRLCQRCTLYVFVLHCCRSPLSLYCLVLLGTTVSTES